MIPLPSQVVRTGSVAAELRSVVAGYGSHAVVVTEAALRPLLDAAGVVPALTAEVIEIAPGEPEVRSVSALSATLAERAPNVVVAIGGGSVLDSAKLATRITGSAVESHLGVTGEFPDGPPVVAVPTTAGSGAEVTRTAVVSSGGRKSWAWGDGLRPRHAVLAGELTLTLPRSVTLASGLDALVHAVEAVTGGRRRPAIAPMGLAAITTILDALPAVLSHPDDREARTAMLEAAAAAGVAIDECGTGAGHAIGHALGSLVRIPHGIAVMAGMRSALEWSLAGAPEAYLPVAAALGVDAQGLIRVLDRLLDEVGFEEALAGWSPPTAAALAGELASSDHQPMCRNNARPMTAGTWLPLAEATIDRWPR